MPTPLTITCPACKAKLKFKDKSAVGKKILCPKCKKSVVVKAPPETDDEFDLGDDFGEEEEFAPPALPQRTSHSRKSTASTKKAKSAPARSKAPLFIGVGVALLLVGTLTTLWWLGVFSRGTPELAANPAPEAAPAAVAAKKGIDLAFLPPDAELFVVVRVADLWSAPLVKSFADSPQLTKIAGDLETDYGLSPGDVESVTVGVAGISEQARDNPAILSPMVLAGSMDAFDAAVVVRLKKSVDAASLKLTASGVTAADHQGKPYYRRPTSSPDEKATAVYLAGPMLLVLGNEDSVKRAIARGEKATDRPDLGFVDLGPQILIAAAPKDSKALTASLPGDDSPQSPLDKVLREKVRAISVGLKLSGGVAVELALSCADSSGEQAVKEELDKSLADARKMFSTVQAALPPGIGQLGDGFMKSLIATGQNSTVRISGAVTEPSQQQLADLPGEIMGLVMQQMMANEGPNPGFPNSTGDDDPAEMSPGDSPSASVSAEDLPDGVAVKAVAEWSRYPDQDTDFKPLPPRLEVSVLVTGEGCRRAAAAQRSIYG